ncbi:MAG: hypothetical protein AUH71_01030 [Thaumarchaeota archaeon 13_1_40CM_4_48_7]|nr:MAG: hypothetical protein AUH71_01030 [Thaumarchaeota archaeon 13_1_40CM_4_48_7]
MSSGPLNRDITDKVHGKRPSDPDISPNRHQILKYIKDNPGAHLRRVSKELGLALGDTQYHLGILQKSGKVRSRKINLYRRYYAACIVGEKEEIIHAFLRQETARDILIYLIEYQYATQSDLARFKQFSSPTIRYHMSRLIEGGIVDSAKDGKNIVYRIRADRGKLLHMLKTYHPGIWNNFAARLADVFEELSYSSNNNGNQANFDERSNNNGTSVGSQS